jgi:cytochrome P450 family 110
MDAATPIAGPSSPALIQAYHTYFRTLAYLDECARKYGDFFTIRIPTFPAPITFVSDPEAIKDIYALDGTDSIEAGSIAAPVMANVIGEHSMLIIDGAEHRRHRSLIMPFFMRGQFSKFGDTILKLTDREIDSWPNGARFPIRTRTRRITLQVILSLLFGEERAASIIPGAVIASFFGRNPSPLVFVRSLQHDLGPLTPWRYFLRLRAAIYRGIANEVARRRALGDRTTTDVIGTLISARDETGAGLAEQEILDELLTMVLAGNDTTATALAWAVYFIYRDAQVLAALREEIEAAGTDASADRLAALPYLEATVKEVLRIAPIFPFTLRRLSTTMRLGSRELPAGTYVAPCIYLVHHREDLWTEPERFDPNRFIEARHPAHHYFPFGGGVRHCVGAALATYEMKLILARILMRADFRFDDGYVARTRWIGNFLGPSKDVPIRFSARIARGDQ